MVFRRQICLEDLLNIISILAAQTVAKLRAYYVRVGRVSDFIFT